MVVHALAQGSGPTPAQIALAQLNARKAAMGFVWAVGLIRACESVNRGCYDVYPEDELGGAGCDGVGQAQRCCIEQLTDEGWTRDSGGMFVGEC
jgi:hypothetical protein